MANGIVSLRGPDKPGKRISGHQFTKRRVAPSDTLSLRELLGAMASAGDTLPTPLYEEAFRAGGHGVPQRAQYSPARLRPLVDSLHAFSRTADHISGRQPARIQTTDELVSKNREILGRGTLNAYNLLGQYSPSRHEIWLRLHDLYGVPSGLGFSSEEAGRSFVDPENDPLREPLVHEFMHSVQRPEWALHGPEAFTANTLTAVWEALAELEHGDKPRIGDVVDRVVELYPDFHSGRGALTELPREEAEEAVRWMVQQAPFRDGMTIREPSILNRLKRGLGSFFKRSSLTLPR